MSNETRLKVEVHGGKERHVDIPSGWKQVTEGKAVAGDKFYNLGQHKFTTVSVEDIGDDHTLFNLLIREKPLPMGWARVTVGKTQKGDRLYDPDTESYISVDDNDLFRYDIEKDIIIRKV